MIPYQTERAITTLKEERKIQKMEEIKQLLRAID